MPVVLVKLISSFLGSNARICGCGPSSESPGSLTVDSRTALRNNTLDLVSNNGSEYIIAITDRSKLVEFVLQESNAH